MINGEAMGSHDVRAAAMAGEAAECGSGWDSNRRTHVWAVGAGRPAAPAVPDLCGGGGGGGRCVLASESHNAINVHFTERTHRQSTRHSIQTSQSRVPHALPSPFRLCYPRFGHQNIAEQFVNPFFKTRVATVLALIRGPVLRSFGSKRLSTSPGPVLEFTIVHLKNPINWHHTVLFCQPRYRDKYQDLSYIFD